MSLWMRYLALYADVSVNNPYSQLWSKWLSFRVYYICRLLNFGVYIPSITCRHFSAKCDKPSWDTVVYTMAFTNFGRCVARVPSGELSRRKVSSKRWSKWKRILLWRGKSDTLSFDMIVNGCTCSPCAVTDFMDYLLYIEHAAENLQFYLWYRDYTHRFSLLSESQRILSPRWTATQRKDAERHLSQRGNTSRLNTSDFTAVSELQELPAPNDEISCLAPFATPPNSVHTDRCYYSHSQHGWIGWNANSKSLESPEETNETAASAFGNVNSFQPLTVQPFRKEINRIVAIYLVDGGPRQLNLTSSERNILIRALTVTTHPSAFCGATEEVEWNLRQQSHPHFIRWATDSTNRQRLLCSRIGSLVLITFGLIAGIASILSTAHRSWRILSAVILLPAISCFIASLDGSCILFLCLYRRQIHPWELFTDVDERTFDKIHIKNGKALDSFGPANSYGDEPWIPRYEKRSFFRKVFDPSIKIQEPEICRVQTVALIRAATLGSAITIIIIAIFLAVPKGNFF